MAADSTLVQVVGAIAAVFERKGQHSPSLDAASPLDGSLGLDSLDFAEVVVRLEQTFGFDPFSEGSIGHLGSIGDLADLYRR